MKIKALILVIAISCSSCGLFKIVEKNKALLETNTAHDIDKTVKETDQGIIKTVERFTFNAAAFPATDFKTFPVPDINSLLGNADAIKKAFDSVNEENKYLKDVINGMKNFVYTKESTENKDLKKDTNEKIAGSTETKSEISNVKKEPAGNLTIIIISCFALFLVAILIFIMFSVRGLKQELQVIKTAKNLLNPE